MCDTVGVAKRLDFEKVSKELADLVAELDHKASSEHVEIDGERIRKIEQGLKEAVS